MNGPTGAAASRAPAWLLSCHVAMTARMGRVAAVCVVIAGVLLALASRIHIENDVAAMLPGGPGSPREAAKLLSEFGALDTLLIDLEMPEASPDALAESGASLASRLRATGLFKDVFEGPSQTELLQVGKVLLPRRLYLFDDPAKEIESRLEPARLKQSLAEVKARLASPQAMVLKKQILDDPLGLDAALLQRMSGQFGEVNYYRGHLLSPDRHHLLLVTRPKEPALNVDASRLLVDRVRGEQEQLPAGSVLHVVGGPRFAAESAQGVKHEVVFNFVTSLLAIAVLFILRFRNVRLLLMTQVPLFFGILVGIAGVSLMRTRVHGLTLGFGAALVGIAVDYPTYFFNRASVDPGNRVDAASAAINDVWSSIWWGFLTTLLAFVAILVSPFPGLRDLALFAGIGISGAFAASVFMLPPLYARFGRTAGRPSTAWAPSLAKLALPRWVAVALTASLALGASLFIPRIRFDGELRHLDAQRPETVAEHQAVMDRFGQLGSTSLIAVTGSDEEQALEGNDTVARWLGEEKASGHVVAVSSISPMLPSKAVQVERARKLRTLDLARDQERLLSAAVEAGFAPGAFDGFWKEIDAVKSGAIVPLAPQDIAGTFIDRLANQAIRCRAPESRDCIAVTAFRKANDVPIEAIGAAKPAGALLVDGGALAAVTMAEIPRQLLLLCGIGLLSNILVLIIAYRSLRLAVAACLPCLVGLLLTVGVHAAVGIPLNLVSASALVLVLGCGVDYGIFALGGIVKAGRAPRTGVEALGVLIAALSTLCGFGTLAMSDQPAMKSLGVAVGLGILVSGLGALFVLPGLYAALFGSREGVR
jgi:predicted exporter